MPTFGSRKVAAVPPTTPTGRTPSKPVIQNIPIPTPPPPVDARKPHPVPPPPARKGPKPKFRVTALKDGTYALESTATGQWAPAIIGLDKQYAEDMLKRVTSH